MLLLPLYRITDTTPHIPAPFWHLVLQYVAVLWYYMLLLTLNCITNITPHIPAPFRYNLEHPKIANSITDLIGRTPLLKLTKVTKGCGAEIIAK